jgi:hypothetical protein
MGILMNNLKILDMYYHKHRKEFVFIFKGIGYFITGNKIDYRVTNQADIIKCNNLLKWAYL